MTESNHEETVENLASSIEDLLRLGIIQFSDSGVVRREKVILTAKFSLILSKVMANSNVMKDNQQALLKALYYAFLIYLDDQIKLPPRLTMAIANDIEKFNDALELSIFVRRYVMVLYNILKEA